MGIMTKPTDRSTEPPTAYGVRFYDPTKRCFYCHQPLSGEGILYWSGCGPNNARERGDLFLHPGCFLDLTIRLFRDLHQVQLKSDYHVLKNASPKLIRSAADREEDRADHDARWHVRAAAQRDKTVVRQ